MLLDGDLNPKISDFGLAKLDEEEKSHISTRVAGTMSVTVSLILSTCTRTMIAYFMSSMKICLISQS